MLRYNGKYIDKGAFMQVNNANHSSVQQDDAAKAQKQQDMQVQREQAKQALDDQRRVQEAAKITGVGQHLDITS